MMALMNKLISTAECGVSTEGFEVTPEDANYCYLYRTDLRKVGVQDLEETGGWTL